MLYIMGRMRNERLPQFIVLVQAGECALLGNSTSESVLKKVLKFLLHYTDETRENVGGSSQVSLIPEGMGFHGTPGARLNESSDPF